MIKVLFSISIFLFLVQCTSKGPLTPKDAFNKIKIAFLQKDAKSLQLLLSKSSIVKIEGMIKDINKLNNTQKKYLASSYNTSKKHLRNISLLSYIKIFILSDSNQLKKAVTKLQVAKIARNKNRAKVVLKNGIDISLVKEGPYWKLDLSNY